MAVRLTGLGPDDLVPIVNKGYDFGAGGLGTEDYFVLTRVDGRTSLRQLLLISGFPEARGLAILNRLHDKGAILLPGESPRPSPETSAGGPTVAAATASSVTALAVAPPPPPPTGLSGPPPPPPVEDVELTDQQRKLIHEKHWTLRDADLFAVLEVPRDADRKALKIAYRSLSKHFHPDRYFGKKLGTYKAKLSEIFDMASTALDVLTDPERRELYIASLDQPQALPPPPSSSTAPRHSITPPMGNPLVRRRAVELFEVACTQHLSGELTDALAGLAQAIAIDPQPRFYRRAAEVALQAQELRLAEEYAKKATELDPTHASAHRIHAKVLTIAGRRAEARQSLEQARKLEPENPHIAAELRDLGAE